MRSFLLFLALGTGACMSSSGGGDGDADVDADADTDTGPAGDYRDYCEAIVPCAQPDPPPEVIDACIDAASGVSQECINCVLAAPDCQGMTEGCAGSC